MTIRENTLQLRSRLKMQVKLKKLHPDAVIPNYAKSGDAGLDLTAVSSTLKNTYIEYGTGLAFEIPEGYVGLIFPRSSISNYTLSLTNSVGVIDSGYRGEIKFRFKVNNSTVSPTKLYHIGDRIGQLIIMPYPRITGLVIVPELSTTERESGGFGHSGG